MKNPICKSVTHCVDNDISDEFWGIKTALNNRQFLPAFRSATTSDAREALAARIDLEISGSLIKSATLRAACETINEGAP